MTDATMTDASSHEPARAAPASDPRCGQPRGLPRSAARWALLAGVAGLAACAMVGPDYHRPAVELPDAFKEAPAGQPAPQAVPPAGWKTAAPADERDPGRWWSVYGDPQLDELVESVSISNQTVASAEAAYRLAIGALGVARAAQWPTLGVTGTHTRGRNAAVQATNSVSASAPITETNRLTLSASWEADLWGRVRRNVESNEASAAASEADLRAAVLSAQATLVQTYLQLRISDAQRKLLEETVAAYERSLEITSNRYDAGVAARTDVSQAQTQLLNARAQVLDLAVSRGQLEHAIAALIGRPPSALSIRPTDEVPALPAVPAIVPSTLLERRPDIGGAERRVAAANAQIGVAQAAFYPTLSLSAAGGTASNAWSNLLSMPYRFWSLGPSLALTLFDAGNRSAVRDQAVARYDQAVATYRQTVLTAFQEVEDNLLALHGLAREEALQREVVDSAAQTLELTNNQYLAGTVSYLNVVTAQTASYSARATALTLASRRLVASAVLMKAMGGLWD
ncbi:MAG: efflux transporter outer membrane subunit [Burkholderiaceae bacterium]